GAGECEEEREDPDLRRGGRGHCLGGYGRQHRDPVRAKGVLRGRSRGICHCVRWRSIVAYSHEQHHRVHYGLIQREETTRAGSREEASSTAPSGSSQLVVESNGPLPSWTCRAAEARGGISRHLVVFLPTESACRPQEKYLLSV